jgi:protease-4
MQRILTLALALTAAMLFGVSCSAVVGSKVAVIPLNGTIHANAGNSLLGGPSITPDLARKQFARVRDDITIKAVVVQVNSPGGDVSACEEIALEMAKVKKPIVVSMRGLAASGGYYISAKADKIVALQSTLTGSIGVISEIPNLTGLLDKIGVKMEIIKAGKYKDMYSGFSELTAEEREIMQRTTDQVYEQFVSVVAEGRHMSADRVRELATGQVYNGLEAKRLGLVDEIGGLQTAIDQASDLAGVQNPSVVFINQEAPSLFNLILNGGGSEVAGLIQATMPNGDGATLLRSLTNTYPRFLYMLQ